MFDFFFLLLFLFGIAALLQMDWIYYLLYVVGGVWLFSHWWVRRSLSQIRVSRRMVRKAFTGEDVPVDLVVTNSSRLPVPWLRIHEGVDIHLRGADDYRIVTNIGGRSVAHHSYRLHCHRRGYYPLGPLRLYTGDLFGFAESSWQEDEPIYVTVYPQVLTLPQLGLPSQLPFGSVRTQQRLFEDPTRMEGVRPYTSGDSLRHVHWRASAHENELLVKKYQPAIALDTSVVLDLDEGVYPLRQRFSTSEWAIVVAASLATHLTKQRQSVGFLTNGWDPHGNAAARPIGSQSGQAHLMTILELLARIQVRKLPEGDETQANGGTERSPAPFALERWLPERASALGWGTTLMLVTPRLGPPLLWALHNLYRRGLNVLVIVCAPSARFDEERARAQALGVQVHQAIWDSDLLRLGQDSPGQGGRRP